MPLADGQLFAGYTILRRLGSGAMGEVYLAQHPRLPRRDALKVLPAQLTADDEYRMRFLREADLAATLMHPHIVAVHDRGEFDGQLWLSMDYIEGTDAAHFLQQSHPEGMPPDQVVRIVSAVADALDYAHQRQLLHRDVKPANILLSWQDSGRERVFLADFGIARRIDDASGLTGTSMTVGTVAYAAPEQLMGQPLDGRADQYALAATAFHLLTGTTLFRHPNQAAVISQHLTAPPPAIAERRPELAGLDPVLCKALAKSPNDRYESCLDFADALEKRICAIGNDLGANHATAAAQQPASEPRGRKRGRKAPADGTPVPPAGAGRHSARSDRKPRGRRALAMAGVVALLVGVGAVGAWRVWGTPHRGGTSSASLAERSSQSAAVAGPGGVVESVAATVPADIRATGRLVVGVNVPYAPNEFMNSSGAIVGFDVDLMNAVARTLGLAADYQETAFDSILPSVGAGTFNVGMSSFSDTKERESAADFVTYFRAGTLWAQRAGSSVDPNAACGLKVGVANGSIQGTTDIPVKSDACVATGLSPIKKVVYPRQDDLTAALIAGKIDAMTADSPVTGFAIKLSRGALVPAGDIFDSTPYGWPVAKGSALSSSLLQALEHLMQTGEYKAIATNWGVDKGMIDKPVINGAIS